MKKPRSFWVVVLVSMLAGGILWCESGCLAQQLGMEAPPLKIAEVVKGSPVNLAEGKGKQVYVVEFWATWCPPCRDSIPHLTELQKKYKDRGVTFIGVSNETADVVKPFVREMGDKMNYTVAVDDNNATFKAYMDAFGVNGIPHAFVVDRQGRIVWHGHPMADLDATLAKVVSNDFKFDPEAAQRLDKARKLVPVYGYLAANVDEPELQKQVAELILRYGAGDEEVAGTLGTIAIQNRKPDNPAVPTAIKAIESVLAGGATPSADLLALYAQLLDRAGDKAKAEQIARQAEQARARSGSQSGAMATNPVR